jgi:pimeloyl-ACP methyl ester carboxylesterase
MTTLQRLVPVRFGVPARRFNVMTDDGVRIAGTRLGPPETGPPAIVMAHGLMGWHAKPRFARFATELARWFTPYALDLRGHGRSGGVSDFGGAEINDVDAVVRLARRSGHDRVVTFGVSMGAIAVLRHGGLLDGVDGVVAVSSLASWDWHDGARPFARRRMARRIESPGGQAMLRVLGVRLPDAWDRPESPEEVIGKIAPTPVLIVHGTDDHLFSEDHARRLYEAAGDPKRLMLATGFGHAEDGLTSAFARRLATAVRDLLGPP